MDHTITVVVYEKEEDGTLRCIDERTWTAAMVASLEHVNYITIDGQEFKTLEGRLNLDKGVLEILAVSMRDE